jgi:glucosyl-3-phosphoglycerate synthase
VSEPVFSWRHFDARHLAEIKAHRGLTASLCIPARNEAETIGRIVSSARRNLVERIPLLDEILVVDDGSGDDTSEVARAAGADVVTSAEILPEAGPGSGKGDAIWKSIHAARGDLICWVDGDIRDFGPRFVTGLLGPLLTVTGTEFVKGFYRRPGGGRVTELVARPLISYLFPHLAEVVQPLAGEYAGRRRLLETLPVVQGWGVDLGLLIDSTDLAGPEVLAQVDLGSRRHRHRSLEELAPQAMAVVVTALRRAGVSERDLWPGGLARFDAGHRMLRVDVEVGERPPLRTVPAYRARLSARAS